MTFTDIFIRRPVLASVISLLIMVLGLRALFGLPIREYPQTENAEVMVTTTYYGASPEVIAGFITTPIEAAVSEAQGIDYLTSTSTSGVSTITARLRLNYDSNRALTEISSKVNSVLNQLPPEAQQPSITVQIGDTVAAMYIGFNSDSLAPNQVNDYVARVVQPKLQAIPGMQKALLLGSRQYAMRIWLDSMKLAAVGLTAQDVFAALQSNNYLSSLGTTRGQMIAIDLTANTDLHSAEEFGDLVLKQKDGALVRLRDVGNVVLGAENYDVDVHFKGKPSLFIAMFVAPNANILTVIGEVRKIFPDIVAQMPAGLHAEIGYDATGYIKSSIDEVVKTLVETLVIVTLVIFLFLGSVRSVIIPVLAMPLSLIGAFFVMLVMGYSINLLTLLALVLAIGLVVDDAIIIVENVDRHLKLGAKPLHAAIAAARELAGPIVAISVVLIAVYIPIGFQGGLTGVMFSEFAFTLAGAVAISAIVALTLSPMMCARFLKSEHSSNALVRSIDQNFNWLTRHYHRILTAMIESWRAVVAFGVVVIVLIIVMLMVPMPFGVMHELAPAEDQGMAYSVLSSASDATPEQVGLYSHQAFLAMSSLPEYENAFQFDGYPTMNQGFGGIVFKPYGERTRKVPEILADWQTRSNQIAGAKVVCINPPALPGSGGGYPTQFVINTTASFEQLYGVSEAFLAKAQATGKFWLVDSDLKIDKPQTRVIVDHDKAALLGLTGKDIGGVLGGMLGGGYSNYFSISGRSYKVMPQVRQSERLNAEQLRGYQFRTAQGTMIPASTVVSLKTETTPETINHFQQLNSATINAVYLGTQGEALELLRKIAAETLPNDYTIDYGGESRQYMQESGGFFMTMGFALIIIFLTLAAQFESFRDPLVIMMSVPMAIFGAMIFIFEGYATLNIYTQVGLVTLLGLIAKHGILIVQFANDLQTQGMRKRQAIEEAAAIRLRPILMTTASMALGVIPLVIASGAGAVGRNHMGLVIAAGISIGTLFTLFVVPAMYLGIARDHTADRKADDSMPVPNEA